MVFRGVGPVLGGLVAAHELLQDYLVVEILLLFVDNMPVQIGFPGSAAGSTVDFITLAPKEESLNAAGWKRVAAFCKKILRAARAAGSRSSAANARLKAELVKHKLSAQDIICCGKSLKKIAADDVTWVMCSKNGRSAAAIFRFLVEGLAAVHASVSHSG